MTMSPSRKIRVASSYYDNEPEPEDQGGWVESSYDSEPEPEDQGGWAGSSYDENEEGENG